MKEAKGVEKEEAKRWRTKDNNSPSSHHFLYRK